jgi:hypothetical protein
MKGISKILVLAVSLAAPASLIAAPAQNAPADATTHTWTIDQVVTDTVSDAWHQGGETEEGFFAIVKTMAQFAAQKRDVTLPDSRESGRRMGQYIKTAGAARSPATALPDRGQGSADGGHASRNRYECSAACSKAIARRNN